MKKDLLKRLEESKKLFEDREEELRQHIDKDSMWVYSSAFDELVGIISKDKEPFEKAMLYVIKNIGIPCMDNVYYFFVERALEKNERLFDHQLDAWINRLTQNLYKATIPLMFREQDGKVVRIAKDDVEAVVQGFFKNYEIAPRFIALSGGIVNNIMNGVVSKHKAFMSTPKGMEPSIPARVKIFWDKVNLDKDWYSHVLYETNFYDAEAINSDQENNGNVELTASLLETILRKMKGKKAEKLLLNVLPKLMSVTDKSKDLGERASELVTAWASKLDWLDAQSDQLAKGSTFDEVLLDNMQEGFEKKKLSVFIEVQKLKTQNIRNINWREFLDAKNAEELEKKFIQFNDDLMKLEFEHLFKKLYIDDLPALKALLGSWAESFQHYEGEAAYLLWSKGNFYDALSRMRGMVGDNASVTAKEIKEVADSLNKIYSDHVKAKKIQMREFERNDYMESRISQSIKREIYLLQCECDKKYGVESPEIVELRKRIQGLDALKIALDAPAQAPKEPIRERQTGLSKREHKAAPRAQSVTPSIEIRGGTSRQLQLREISDEIRESTKVIYLEPWMTQNLINQLRSHNNQSQGRQILWCFGENVFCYNVATHPENRKYSAVRDEDKSKGQASNIKDLSAEQANECCRGIVSIGGDIDTFSQIFHDSLDRVMP